ncbi:MAG: D-glycero-beta-D-manno-heptose-7-phosphate kinase [Bdellovibrionaceae bacterium]|nr:D-glycero-beta-D-manno-heptose-7-phosphate kinase [Bdellovibrionales bacterium]MCB9086603.1 D-glycero-beta-D-manno-heptose-7-phosphate kinase [Pseudobdellovibrionaceae bacterium]
MNVTSVEANQLKPAREKILAHLDQLNGRQIIVVGDLGLDQYVMGDVRRISPEAPVPVLEVNQEDRRLGLATNVAQNIASLGGIPLLVGVVGADPACEDLKKLLLEARVPVDHLIVDKDRPTTRKLRVMSGHHHLVRVDYEHRRFLSREVEDQLLAKVASLLPGAQGVVLEDYAKGVVSERCVQEIVKLCQQEGKPLLVDPNRQTPAEYYRGATLMTPNRDEAYDLSGLEFDDLRDRPDSLFAVGGALVKNLGLKNLVITEGKKGMSLFEGERVTQLPTYARQVFDVTGAGDTVIAALALAWLSGFSLSESCILANFAAGVVVGKVGCVPCSQEELVDYIKELHPEA